MEEARDFMNCEQLVRVSFCFHCGSVRAVTPSKIQTPAS